MFVYVCVCVCTLRAMCLIVCAAARCTGSTSGVIDVFDMRLMDLVHTCNAHRRTIHRIAYAPWRCVRTYSTRQKKVSVSNNSYSLLL